jgi:hypothetical protein
VIVWSAFATRQTGRFRVVVCCARVRYDNSNCFVGVVR